MVGFTDTESTPLVSSGTQSSVAANFALDQSKTALSLLGIVQIALVLFFAMLTTYDEGHAYSSAEYVVFRDIMVMLLLGFGYLMTFLGKYGLGAVGFTMLLVATAVPLNVAVEYGVRIMYEGIGSSDDTSAPLPLGLSTFIDGEFSAATLLISYGAVIGRATPTQLVVMAIAQSVFYAVNKVVLVLGMVSAEDVGGSLTIHMFGAYFGLAVSKALGPPQSSSASNADATRESDVLALIGTTLLWVYWPSFVGATETDVPANENLCVLNTILALLGSTIASFYMSAKLCHGKFDPVHIANSTLAGGVAVGASARLAITPFGAFVLGMAAGIISVLGYAKSSPYLESIGIFDTCGVGNLHGYPSIVGGLASAMFVFTDSSNPNLPDGGGMLQCIRQLSAVGITLAVSMISGSFTGSIMRSTGSSPVDYEDGVWWEGDYFE